MTDRAHKINGAIFLLAIIAGYIAIASNETPEPPRKFGPQAWEPGFKPNKGEWK